MTVQTDEEARRREAMTGATAIPRVKYGSENHCASPITSVAFTLPKQCNRPPTMKRSGQLGCRASEPARQPSRLKGLTRDPMFGKFSDASREDRLEADLPEVNLPPRCRLRGGAGEPIDKRVKAMAIDEQSKRLPRRTACPLREVDFTNQ